MREWEARQSRQSTLASYRYHCIACAVLTLIDTAHAQFAADHRLGYTIDKYEVLFCPGTIKRPLIGSHKRHSIYRK